jgi:DeoR/GlpR family transcriptional regulator of sugar metabolism
MKITLKKVPHVSQVQNILNRLRKTGRISINEDAKRFNVSISTRHRDLEDLEKQGLVKKVMGGAVLVSGTQFATHFDKRKNFLKTSEVKSKPVD